MTRMRSLGFTFIEMLVALAINAVLLLAITSIFSTHFGYFNTTKTADTLEQQLQMSMDLMANDIKRAGFWLNAYTDIAKTSNGNPFMASATDISINGSCILFTYDHAKNGILPAISSAGDDDRYGFRLINNVLQTRPPGATFACNAAATNWENITNPAIVRITALSFTLNQENVPSGATSYIMVRSIDISITGELVGNASITKTFTQRVRIRNDKYTS